MSHWFSFKVALFFVNGLFSVLFFDPKNEKVLSYEHFFANAPNSG